MSNDKTLRIEVVNGATRVFVDGQEMTPMLGVRFLHYAGDIPRLTLDLVGIGKMSVPMRLVEADADEGAARLRELEDEVATHKLECDRLRKHMAILDYELKEALESNARLVRDELVGNEKMVRLREQVVEKEKEIEADDVLLAQYEELLDLFPCPAHGRCISHAKQVVHELYHLWERVTGYSYDHRATCDRPVSRRA